MKNINVDGINSIRNKANNLLRLLFVFAPNNSHRHNHNHRIIIGFLHRDDGFSTVNNSPFYLSSGKLDTDTHPFVVVVVVVAVVVDVIAC